MITRPLKTLHRQHANMLVARSSARNFGVCKLSKPRAATLRCNVAMKSKDFLAAVTAGALLLAPAPAFASLPEGLRSPQGSNSAAVEAKLDALIEQRTGKAAPLPELNEVSKDEIRIERPTPAVPLVAPMAPAVMDPPPPPAALIPAAVEPTAAEAQKPAPSEATAASAVQQAVDEAPAPAKKGLQHRNAPTAAAATTSSNTGLLIGGGAAFLGVVAAAALSSNNQSAEQTATAASTTPTAPADGATPSAAESLAAAAGAASPEGTTTSPTN